MKRYNYITARELQKVAEPCNILLCILRSSFPKFSQVGTWEQSFEDKIKGNSKRAPSFSY